MYDGKVNIGVFSRPISVNYALPFPQVVGLKKYKRKCKSVLWHCYGLFILCASKHSDDQYLHKSIRLLLPEINLTMTLQNCKIRPSQLPYFFLYAGQIHKLSDVRVFEAPYITGFSHVLHLIKSCQLYLNAWH